jgi:hypothetical protein
LNQISWTLQIKKEDKKSMQSIPVEIMILLNIYKI